jgi:hypothetical protein
LQHEREQEKIMKAQMDEYERKQQALARDEERLQKKQQLEREARAKERGREQ